MDVYPTVFRIEPVKPDALDMHIGHVARSQIPDIHVDVDRIKENMVIIGSGDHASIKRDLINETLKHKVSNKKAGVVYASGFLSANRDYFDKRYPGWQTDSSILKPWIDANIPFLNSGKLGIVKSAILHLDEEAPHIHYISIPVTTVTRGNRYGKKQVERLSYNAMFSDSKQHIAECRKNGTTSINTKLGVLQTVYANEMGIMGLVRGVTSGVKHVKPKEYRDLIKFDADDVPMPDLELDEPAVLSWKKTHKENAKKAYDYKNKVKKTFDLLSKSNKSKDIKIDMHAKKIKAQEKTITQLTKKMEEQATLIKENKPYLDAMRMLSKDTIIGCFDYHKSAYADYNFKKKFNGIDFIKHVEKCDFNQALVILSERFLPDDICIVASQSEQLMRSIQKRMPKIEREQIPYDLDDHAECEDNQGRNAPFSVDFLRDEP